MNKLIIKLTIAYCFAINSGQSQELVAMKDNQLKYYFSSKGQLSAHEDNDRFNFHPYVRYAKMADDLFAEFKDLKKFSYFSVNQNCQDQVISNISTERLTVSISDLTAVSSDIDYFPNPSCHPKLQTYIEHFGEGNVTFNNDFKPYFLTEFDHSNRNADDGFIAEILIYDDMLNSKQRKVVESYLAIKYGISLVDTATYVNSSNEVLFKATQDYKYRVTAIGRDDGTGLYQKQSKNTQDTDLKFTIGLGEIASWNEYNNTFLEDRHFLFWADNDLDLKFDEESVVLRRWRLKSINHSFHNSKLVVSIDPSVLRGWTIDDHIWLGVKGNDSEENSDALHEFKWVNGRYECYFNFPDVKGEYLELYLKMDRKVNSDPFISNEIKLFPNLQLAGQEISVFFPKRFSNTILASFYKEDGTQERKERISVNEDNYIYHFKTLSPGVYTVHLKNNEIDKTLRYIVTSN